MTARLPLTLPAYIPTSWELTLPGYPVIVASFRSVSYPDILGSLPSDSRWRLFFRNMTNAEALALLLPWKASGCGIWSLTTLPAELASGVNDANFRKRLTGTTWTIEKEPTKESVKNGRFNVTIELIHELTFESIYGPLRPSLELGANPVLLGTFNVLSIAGLVAAVTAPVKSYSGGPVLNLGLPYDLSITGLPDSITTPISSRNADAVLNLAIGTGLSVAAVLP